MAKRKSTNSSAAGVSTIPVGDVATKPQDGSAPINAGAGTTPSGENGPDGINTGAVDGSADAHDQAGGPATNPPAGYSYQSANSAGLAEAIALTGCTDLDDLVDMANVGRSLLDAIVNHTAGDGPLKGWSPADDPAEVVGDLIEMIAVQDDLLAAARATAGASEPEPAVQAEKREFVALGRIRLDNHLVRPGGSMRIEEKQHAALAAAGLVDPDWDEGV